MVRSPGSLFNPASPGAIGGTTPGAGSFTTLGATGLLAFSAAPVARKTADQSITTATALADATGLSFAIGANEEWVATFDLSVGDALGTTGLNVGVNAPAGATVRAHASVIDDNLHSLARESTSIAGVLPYSTTNFSGSNAGKVSVNFWVLNGATPGTIQLQFAQQTSSGTALTLKKGSFMRANRIA